MALAFDTYANLQLAIAEILHRTDMGAAMPGLIDLCEAEMARRLDVAEQEASTTLTLNANANTVALPTGFVSLRRLRLYYGGAFYPINILPMDESIVTVPSTAGLIGDCSIQGSNLVFTPSCAEARTLYIDYGAKFTPLSDANPSNWILASHPDAYVYGSLKQAGVYVGADPRFVTRVAQFNEMYNAAIAEITRLDRRKRFDQSTVRNDAAVALNYPRWRWFNAQAGF